MAELQTKDKNVQPNAMVMPDSAQSIGRVRVGNMNGKVSSVQNCLTDYQISTVIKKIFLIWEELS